MQRNPFGRWFIAFGKAAPTLPKHNLIGACLMMAIYLFLSDFQ